MRAFSIFALSIFVCAAASATTYTVSDLGDAADATPGDDICATAGAVCTLRAAIEEANAHAGADAIAFSVAGGILAASPLPQITQQLTIDGTTAPGYGAAPVVSVSGGALVAGGITFAVGSNNSMVDGLEIVGFTDAGVIVFSSNVTVRRNYIGTSVSGNDDGVRLFGLNATVGGANGFGNVIGGNSNDGISVTGGSGHTISDNFIGTDPTGTIEVPNGSTGVYVTTNSGPLTIGGAPGAENLISGNGLCGVLLDNASGVTIAGNLIGTDITGTLGMANLGDGVEIIGNNNTIGMAGRFTLISRNAANGVAILEPSSGNVIINSFLGGDGTLTGAFGNELSGVSVADSGNTVGMPGAGNVIIANSFDGVTIACDMTLTNVVVQANTILNNGASGVAAVDANNITVGGTTAGLGNVLSGNFEGGVFFDTVSDSFIVGNTIGLAADQDTVLSNTTGIAVVDSMNIAIGGPGAGRNVISGNLQEGVVVFFGAGNIVENNRIGTNGAGTLVRANGGSGILYLSTTGGIIRSNLVSGNGFNGIEVETTTGATVHSNLVGVAADGVTPMGNSSDGIYLCSDTGDTVVGSVALGGNTVANNGEHGVSLETSALLNNSIIANSIYNNGGLGIDLDRNLPTPNDPQDPDPGPNALQNFPTVAWAVANATQTFVQGSLNSTPSTSFGLHFYSSVAGDPSGAGEGQTYLGTTNVITDVAGDATYSFAAATAVPAGQVITATATGAVSGTSEFSNFLSVGPAPTVQFSAANYPVLESGGSVMITVNRTGDTTGTSTVNYATSNGTATIVPADYTATSGTLTFGPGVLSQTFNVTIINDALDEADETINLTLSLPNAAALGAQSVATITIQDDDPPPSLSINDVTLNEGNAGTTPFVFTVTLSAASGQTVTVNYATANGTAIAGTDYNTASGTLTFLPGGPLTQTITVNVIGNLTFEPNKTFVVNLSGATNATISDSQGVGTITNDDTQPTISINDVTMNEGNAGLTPFVFTVSLSNASVLPITVNYATANGTAIAGTDYNAAGAMLTFNPGSPLTQTITVNVIGNLVFEANKTFFVNLSGATNATIADGQGIGTITNDDGVPTLSINNVTQNEGNAGTTPFVFTVTLSNPSASTVTVDFATANGTATAGVDYAATNGTLTFTPGTLTQPITVNVTGETAVEPNETFFVNLTNPANATIAVAQAIGTITNDDVAPTGADLSITKTSVVTDRINMTYTIVVTNGGPGTATGVTVTDPLQGSQLLSATSTVGTCSGTTGVTCVVGTLANGASATITIVVAAQQSIVNTTTVSANEPDPNPANNTATAMAPIPTLSVWLLLALAAVLGTIALTRLKI